MLPKVNKDDMDGMMESIEEYLQSSHDVISAPLACIIMKSITVQVMTTILSMKLLTII